MLKFVNPQTKEQYPDVEAEVVVSAVGGFSTPLDSSSVPIKGLNDFKGEMWHSARWNWSADLENKKIAAIGNGCSAFQFVPELAKIKSSHIYNFSSVCISSQGTVSADSSSLAAGARLGPLADPSSPFRRRLSGSSRTSPASPGCSGGTSSSGATSAPSSSATPGAASTSARSRKSGPRTTSVVRRPRSTTSSWCQSIVSPRISKGLNASGVLILRLLALGCKRIVRLCAVSSPRLRTDTFGTPQIMDPGYLASLGEPNVDLVTDSIDHVDATGIVTKSGKHYDLDTIILGTGASCSSQVDKSQG